MTLTAKRARTEAKKVANYLRRKHGATTVILFGSALRSEDFSPNRSDIDIYFEGWLNSNKATKTLTGFFTTFYS